MSRDQVFMQLTNHRKLSNFIFMHLSLQSIVWLPLSKHLIWGLVHLAELTRVNFSI